MKYLTSILLTGFILTGLITHPSSAQILELKQTVYGMDCAPCAHGLEKRMSNLEGVESATVSLNNSLLEAKLNSENNLTLLKIRKSVEDSGFQPKEAELKIAGVIRKEDDSFILETEAGEEFVLTSDDRKIDSWFEGLPQKAVITGKAEEGKAEKIKMVVQAIEKPAG